LRRLAWCALALAAACGSETKSPSNPLVGIRMPTGLAVHGGRLLALSSNGDLTYDEASGGSLLALDVAPSFAVSIASGVRVRSFGGDLAVARAGELRGLGIPDGEACGTALGESLAVFGTRGSNTLNAVSVAADGSLSCAGPAARCGIPIGGAGFGDPLGVTVACGGARPRAYFGYLTAQSTNFFVGQLDLVDFSVKNAPVGIGAVRGLAYDRDRDRLFMTGVATSTPTPLRWFDLAGCTFGASGAQGCTLGAVALPLVSGSYAVELHGIALAHSGLPRGAGEPVRAYLSGIVYDQGTAATNGFRTTNFGGVLAVVDLFDDARGGVVPVIQAIYEVPAGAQAVRILPRLPGWATTRRDVVAVVSVDVGTLTVIDDETSAMETFGLDAAAGNDAATGGPILGHQAYGLAVDPATAGSTARLWVGSFKDSFVTPIDVTLDPVLAATFAGGRQLKITGATP
jgi:hypothetical protein